MPAFRVFSYSKDKFKEILEEKAHPDCDVGIKGHIDYFDEYFSKIKIKTVLVEEEYVDKDFLEDFSAYYVRCFGNYKRFCSRLHFFLEEYDEVYFGNIISGKNNDLSSMQASYAGFLVVKPLPKTIIGRTCLINYRDLPNSPQRYFPTNKNISVNLFGVPLSVSSLAFQEQDTDVAACATSALWSAFQGTGRIFQHSIPSPVEITRAASFHVRGTNRNIPAHEGLTAAQMADAIRSVGLEPHSINVQNSAIFRATAYAYLRAGIPCLCIGDVRQINPHSSSGLHAITLTGYRFGATAPTPPQPGPQFRAHYIDRLYAHDDQVGPFARLRFSADGDVTKPILTSWLDDNKAKDNIAWDAEIALIPIYHKIRVPFVSIVKNITYFDALIKWAMNANVLNIGKSFEWDVYLCEGSKLKNDRLIDNNRNSFDEDILTRNLPKYIWIADALVDGRTVFQFVFDATDLLQGSQFISTVPLDKSFNQEVAKFFSSLPHLSSANKITRTLIKWFSDNSKNI